MKITITLDVPDNVPIEKMALLIGGKIPLKITGTAKVIMYAKGERREVMIPIYEAGDVITLPEIIEVITQKTIVSRQSH